jgi:DNA polymerase-3 subunit delta
MEVPDRPESKLPPIALFWGEDQFLIRDAARMFLDSHGLHGTEVDAGAWQGGETSDLATPSLWGERRALLVSGCQALSEAGASELRGYLESPSPDAICVMTQVSRAKGPPPLAKLVEKAGGLVRKVALKRQDLPKWTMERARLRGAGLTQQGAGALVATVGEDPATLDQAVEQLAAAFAGERVGPDHVRAQFRGLGEQRVWDLCDRAFDGRLEEALGALRSLLEAREDPLLILGGIAARCRDLIRVRGLPERMTAVDAARRAGLRFDWQVRRYREQARRYEPGELSALHERVAEADRALKGGVPGDVVLTILVAAMAGQPEVALSTPIRVSR